eukprot:TRINITY_DN30515_c4_g1_i1.p1 TRINITY_DN30515_c4_g1~~TRINITY_DN30515_c4_g1_i1.p1  ORF type:complete len:100 (+),score=15.38 TRINITY_DN30515_c4_g1_i1:248-547(+)
MTGQLLESLSSAAAIISTPLLRFSSTLPTANMQPMYLSLASDEGLGLASVAKMSWDMMIDFKQDVVAKAKVRHQRAQASCRREVDTNYVSLPKLIAYSA